MQHDLLEILQADGAEIVELCAGRNREGREFHAFVQMNIESYRQYREALSRNDPLDLNAFGKILHAGWGRAPDKATARRVMETRTDNLKILETIGRDSRAMADVLKRNCRESLS